MTDYIFTCKYKPKVDIDTHRHLLTCNLHRNDKAVPVNLNIRKLCF